MPSDSVEEARLFAKNFMPRTNVDYGWVARYAVPAWQYTDAASNVLTAKAEKLIGFITVAAVATAAGIVKAGSEAPWIAIAALPALVCWISAVSIALIHHTPADHGDLPGIDQAIGYAEQFADAPTAEAAFAAKVHQSREMTRRLCELRGKRIQQAYVYGLAGVWCLALPVAFGIWMGFAVNP